jgi:phosphate transport system substrate-binding protein
MIHKHIPWYKNPLLLVPAVIAIPGAVWALIQINQWSQNTKLPYATIAAVPDIPDMPVRYGGSTSFAPIGEKQQMSKRIYQAHPGFKLIYTNPPNGDSPGSKTGIRMLLNGGLDFAEVSQALAPSEHELTRKKGFTIEDKKVAYDSVVFYVNRNLHLAYQPNTVLPGLAIPRLKSILTGEITNWKEVGGSDLPITVFSRDPKVGGTPEFVKENVMDKKDFAKSVQFKHDTTASIRSVDKTPGGIGFATASEVCHQKTVHVLPIVRNEKQPFVNPCNRDPNTNRVNLLVLENATYPLTRPMFVIIKRDGGLSEKAGAAYFNMLWSDEGQQIIKHAGLAPARHGKK